MITERNDVENKQAEKQDFIFYVIHSSAEKTTGLPLSVAHIVKSATLESTISYERTLSDRTSLQHNRQQQQSLHRESHI